jgi:nitrate/nitrite transport system permease protein
MTPSWALAAKSSLLSLLILGVWHLATLSPTPVSAPASSAVALTPEQIEYAKLMGKDLAPLAAGAGTPTEKAGFPTLMQMGRVIAKNLASPFYDNGPNDKGIGLQLGYSLGRVGLGYLLAALVAIPLGFVIGMSPLVYRALDPFI